MRHKADEMKHRADEMKDELLLTTSSIKHSLDDLKTKVEVACSPGKSPDKSLVATDKSLVATDKSLVATDKSLVASTSNEFTTSCSLSGNVAATPNEFTTSCSLNGNADSARSKADALMLTPTYCRLLL